VLKDRLTSARAKEKGSQAATLNEFALNDFMQ
jgi:hypothetical protein